MADVASVVSEVVPAGRVASGDNEDYWHDEALGATPQPPACVVFPESTEEVAAILRVAHAGGIVVAFERMNALLDLDTENQVAVVQPGMTLAELDEVTAKHGLIYPVFPGEYS